MSCLGSKPKAYDIRPKAAYDIRPKAAYDIDGYVGGVMCMPKAAYDIRPKAAYDIRPKAYGTWRNGLGVQHMVY